MSGNKRILVGAGTAPLSEGVLASTQKVIHEALERLGYGESYFELLKEPLRLLTVRIPVRMDDGQVKVFTGYRAQHTDAVGPTKGGIRFHPSVTAEEVSALSLWMTLKCGIFDLPYGGGKGGIICDPRTMSLGEVERLARGYVRAISQIVGPNKDIPAPDVYTNAQIMAWMLDEYSRIREYDSPGFITGKPLVIGGSQGRDKATSLGVAIALRETAAQQGMALKGLKVCIQGFGNVGSHLAEILDQWGAIVVGISDVHGGIYDEKGLDVQYLLDRRDSFGSVTNLFSKRLTTAEFLALPCDVLVPAALENQITMDNVDSVQAKLVIEAANGPTSLEASDKLHERGVLVLPDVLANAGGVTVSYFEWVQNNQGYYWTEEEVNSRLETKMVDSVQKVLGLAKSRGVTPRLAAYMVGVQKYAEASRLRGWV
ncbi:Glu/Leu/Phe/Val family dehydrogenase [Paenibacillus ginsengarvi]|uniref:Glutamate dehydrogenase n=1 Tax=Paenibacillus ginsengarvi TaxID=400777 RepID=A0A3B0CGT4_9BACL|nr:Glu/Leu/Phe/Val dehydrogenase [Paenibacillus ginsengarvi]RKN84048.1 Glu/Leu/Phe/Val dehydrogenase [Paenibacillus ginsengarvi]